MRKMCLTFLVVIFLASCGNTTVEPQDNNGIFQVTVIENGNERDIVSGETITITEVINDEYLGDYLSLKGNVKNLTSETLDLEVTVSRTVNTGASDELCIVVCELGNGQASQNFSGRLNAGQVKDYYTHLVPPVGQKDDYVITYNFHQKGTTSPNVEVTVIYRY